MDFLKKIFPMSFQKSSEVGNLVKRIVIYAILSTVVGILGIAVLLLKVPVLDFFMSLIVSVTEVYCTGGIVLAILFHCNVIKLDGESNVQ